MKKSLLALAVLGTFAGAASAQSNVSIYGIADMALDFQRGGPAGSVTKLSNPFGSRIGFRGTEDLGGGMSASFVLESGITLDTGGLSQGGLMYGRQAHVGVKGNFGGLTFGRQYSPRFLALAQVADPFSVGFSGQAHNLIDPDGVRVNNAVKYTTPTFNGFTADLMVGLGEVVGDSSAGRQTGTSLGYVAGPLNVRLAYHARNGNPSTVATTKNTMLAGTYDFGVAKMHLAFSDNDGPAAKGGVDNRDFLIGATVPLGVNTIRASYIRKDDRTAANRDASQFAVGVFHALSKRTDLYTVYSRISNENGATFTVNNGSDAGVGNRGINVGLRHFF